MVFERDGELSTLEQLPADARIIALLTDEAAESFEALVEVAATIAERRGRTLVLGIGAAGEALDAGLGTSDAPGVAEVMSGEAKLTDVTRRAAGRRFLHVPVGRSSEPPPSAGIRSLIERVRAAAGTLIVVAPIDRCGLPDEWFDLDLEIPGPTGAASAAKPALRMPSEAEPEPSEAQPEPPVAVAMPSEAMPEPRRWGRHRLQQRLPLSRIAIAAAALIALLVGWWLLARVVTRASTEGSLPAAVSADERSVPAEGEPPEGVSGESLAVESGTSPDLVAAAAAAPELGFSVLVASYAQSGDALSRARRVSDGSILFFVAPTDVRGRTYHRLFAGALTTRDSARALMGELMGLGIKDAISSWDIRPVSLGYLLSVHASREAARSAERELLERGIPAYSIPLVAEGDTVHQVYAGAYERSEDAVSMRALLRDAGVDAELVPRRGEPR